VPAVLPDLARPPALVHGDIWFGKGLREAAGPAHLIDPAVRRAWGDQLGDAHPGSARPHVERVGAAQDETYPLAEGRRVDDA
jgi:fructosamine-3-kinase